MEVMKVTTTMMRTMIKIDLAMMRTTVEEAAAATARMVPLRWGILTQPAPGTKAWRRRASVSGELGWVDWGWGRLRWNCGWLPARWRRPAMMTMMTTREAVGQGATSQEMLPCC